MRYLELFEFQDEPAPAAVEPQAAMKEYFHVTTKHRLRSIEQNGIEPNHPRRRKTGYGMQLGERGNIYLFSDFPSAVRWAYKTQWEHYHGKEPDPSPYIIIQVHEDPKALQPDPHPENSIYGNTWFQKPGKIAPEDIMQVIPLTKALIQQVIGGSEPVTESTSLLGLTSHYSLPKCLKALADKGWAETQVQGEYRAPDYPEFSIDLDIDNPEGGPFTVFHGSQKLATTRVVPFAKHLGLKYGLTDHPEPRQEVEKEWWER